MKIQIRSLLMLFCAATASLLITGSPAQAGYIVTLEQVGPNVVATGSGALDLTGLTFGGNSGTPAETQPKIDPNFAIMLTGSGLSYSFYHGVSGPKSYGSGGETVANSGTGDEVGINGFGGNLFVPQGYVSGTALSDTATYDSATFSNLGVTPGTYEWTWGTGANQNFTLDAVAVPEPSALPLFGLGVLLLIGAVRFRSRQLA